MTQWVDESDSPLAVTEHDDLDEVCKVMRHARSEGLGVQVWSFIGREDGHQSWTVELYAGTPVIGRVSPPR